MVFVACRNSNFLQKLNIIVYFLTCSYSISFLKICDNTFENMRSRDIQIQKCQWTQGKKMRQSKSQIKNSKLFYMDTQGSLTHISAIFKFGDVSGPRAKKLPKVNRRLKIVNYFTCMRHFSCWWYRPPEVDLNGYPRISNPYYCDI